MTIEEKAKAYDEAVNKLRRFMARGVEPLITRADVQDFFPELAESKDEMIREKLIEFFKDWGKRLSHCWGLSIPDILAWLEKQGEQKPDDIRTTGYWNVQEVKYKPADRIEPKFKIGDWIYHEISGNAFHINRIENHTYISDEGATISFGRQNDWRLWTIQDAEDGDVLVTLPIKGQEGEKQIFVFKGINNRDYVDNCIEYYCRVCEGIFYKNTNGYMGTTSSLLCPATKEQRDLLFAKMHEAGYTFDFEKKELKKIEPNLSNSPEIGKNDTLLDLLNKMPSYITVDGIFYHFMLRKTALAYTAYYSGEEEGSCKVIFLMTSFSPIDLLTEILDKLKEEGLLE